jgi:transposase-like protein
MPRRYPPEFRHRVLELVRAGRSVTEVARELGVSSQAIYNWRRQAEIDAGLRPGITTTDNVDLVAARRRIAELEAELTVTRRANELLREAAPPKDGSRRLR